MKKSIFCITSIILGIILGLLGAEICCRMLLKNSCLIKKVSNEKTLSYRYDKQLGWFPIEGKTCKLNGVRKILVRNNKLGFRDNEHGQKNKPRILFLGDSYVWGYDVEQEERFTEKLQKKLQNHEIINCGISGYGTDQEYLVLKKFFNIFKPDLGFLIFCNNDYKDNSRNIRSGYYKPYFIVEQSNLILKGVVVPKSYNYYAAFSNSYLARLALKAILKGINPAEVHIPDPTKDIILSMNKFLKENNTPFIIGLINQDNFLKAFCLQQNIKYIGLDNSHHYQTQGQHWTPRGHNYVTEIIYNFLLRNKLLF